MRRANEDGVDEARLDHEADIGESLLALLKRWDGTMAFAKAGDFESGDLAGANVSEMGFAHIAKSNDAKSDGFHSVRVEGFWLGHQASGRLLHGQAASRFEAATFVINVGRRMALGWFLFLCQSLDLVGGG